MQIYTMFPVMLCTPRIDEVLKLVELEDRASNFVNTYSGGMRRRLEIARSLIHYPQSIIFG